MSKNIDQIFIANPITKNVATDLMYFGQSPYGLTNDAAMTYANFSAQFAPAFLGGFTFAGTLTGNTTVTFPTSGTLATTAQLPLPGITNVNQTTSTATLAAGDRYATNNGATLVTYTIPAGAAVGDTYIIVGGSSGGWTVAQPASVTCHIDGDATTTGVGGSISSTNQYDCLTLTCVASNTFTGYALQGNLTVV